VHALQADPPPSHAPLTEQGQAGKLWSIGDVESHLYEHRGSLDVVGAVRTSADSLRGDERVPDSESAASTSSCDNNMKQ
jgi:hypothetical protein